MLSWTSPKVQFCGLGALALLATFFTCVRMVSLDADFPPGYSWSGDLYTDEGWKCSGAVRWALTGDWHLDGDNNPAVSVPGYSLLQAAAFLVTKPGHITARGVTVVLFMAMQVALFFMLRRHGNTTLALLGCLLNSANFFVMAFSRMALLEVPMMALVIISLALLVCASDGPGAVLRPTLVGLIFAFAVLVKTNAVFALPAIAYLLWNGHKPLRSLRITAFCIPLGVVFLMDLFLVILPHHDDFTVFMKRNTVEMVTSATAGGEEGFFGPIIKLFNWCRPLMALFAILCVLSVNNWRTVMKDGAVRILTILLGCYLCMLVVVKYAPARYHVPGVMLLGMLTSVLAWRLLELRSKALTAIVCILLAGYVAKEANDYRHWYNTREYSYKNMCISVASKVRAETNHSPVVLGDAAATFGLAMGILTIDDVWAPTPLEYRLDKYCPTHYLSLGEPPANVRETLEKRYYLNPIASYDVLRNYYKGRKMILFRLEPKHSRPAPQPKTQPASQAATRPAP